MQLKLEYPPLDIGRRRFEEGRVCCGEEDSESLVVSIFCCVAFRALLFLLRLVVGNVPAFEGDDVIAAPPPEADCLVPMRCKKSGKYLVRNGLRR